MFIAQTAMAAHFGYCPPAVAPSTKHNAVAEDFRYERSIRYHAIPWAIGKATTPADVLIQIIKIKEVASL